MCQLSKSAPTVRTTPLLPALFSRSITQHDNRRGSGSSLKNQRRPIAPHLLTHQVPFLHRHGEKCPEVAYAVIKFNTCGEKLAFGGGGGGGSGLCVCVELLLACARTCRCSQGGRRGAQMGCRRRRVGRKQAGRASLRYGTCFLHPHTQKLCRLG